MTAEIAALANDDQHRMADGPDERLAQLSGALALVARLAGDDAPSVPLPADVATAYSAARPIARRRFDALAAETAAFSAAGIEVLLRQRAGGSGDCRAAAARLASEMRTAISAMLQAIDRRG